MRTLRRLLRALLAVALGAVSVVALSAQPAYAHFCHETVNPAGNPAVGDNGFPNDPFGGDAVPGGKSTSPGTNGNSPINSDGFYLVEGLIFSDDTPIAFPGGGFSWPTTAIKYTEVGGNNPPKVSTFSGPNSVVKYHIQATGDLFAEAGKSAGGDFCGVPPPPF
jgi:hypothetical protein